MKIKGIEEEVFQDYRKPSMLIVVEKCDFKCLTEQGLDISICQNSSIKDKKTIEISNREIIRRYKNNPITRAIIFGGLEPLLQFQEVLSFIKDFREVSNDDVVIYTGYYEEEILREIKELLPYGNIIIKFGRYFPNREKRFDEVLGVWLSSDNQYAIKIPERKE